MAKKAKRKTSTAKSKKRKVVKSKSTKKAKKQSASKRSNQPKLKTRKKAAKKARAPRSKALRTTTESFYPPHKCERTPSGCLMFFPDENGEYVRPRGGLAVDCVECKHFFD
ncbi:dUTPase [Bradyrhizobium japonicum USDA 38]|uniref:hypothetical protein n=1 Tax=Bradyrhizobium japonicum TaxID=375 RepID=UPI0012BB8942|nr:hypothetical protein [Bradyrhizobium japonicum]MCS3892890.1 dUTPase [Bradyrhizobium japonicum USDA 38]MCS3945403.1 dUTPase [Bradyrhizobium japonicum]MCW2222071.1 dUTPase [Bradyrhizobium japonicum]MCW2346683.1 dUTPase [Bradyrhizobium japonicum]